MFYTEWEVLLVDDEPDVLAVSKLAMKDFTVYGLPLTIHSVQNKAQALAFLRGRPDQLFSRIAVAFIDVVMESDSAGLELCQEIREKMHNHLTQLFIRTGQPGIAPERTVIDRYDINGYFTKTEATEDKLYSLVKSGIRQWMTTVWTHGAYRMLNGLITKASSKKQLEESHRRMLQGFDRIAIETTPESGQRAGVGHGLMFNDRIISSGLWIDETTVAHQIERMSQLNGRPLNGNGDQFIFDNENNQFLIKIEPQVSNPEVRSYFSTAFEPPMSIVMLVHNYLKSFSTLWQQAN